MFEETIALAPHFALDASRTVIPVVAGSTMPNFSPPAAFFIRAYALIPKSGWRWCTSEWKRGRMTNTVSPLIKAIDIATSSKAILRHVQGFDRFEPMLEQEEFCGQKLRRFQNDIPLMLLALSMELALKAWIVRDGTEGDIPRTHDLSKLFSRTSEATQERLKTRFENEIASGYPTMSFKFNRLECLLKDARKAFVNWRYSYELSEEYFESGIFKETVEMILSEFEGGIRVRKQPLPFSGV